VIESDIRSVNAGKIVFNNLNAVPFKDAESGKDILVVLKRNGELAIHDDKDRELEKHKIPYGARVLVTEGDQIERRTVVCEWDPHLTPILAEAAGQIRFQDVVEGETVRIDSEAKGKSRYIVVEHRGDKNPQVVIEDAEGKILEYHYLPAKARIEVEEGDKVIAGSLLARRPRELSGTQDITGGLPRVTELFEARKPKEPAVMAEISGTVEIRSDKRRGKMTIIINPDSKDLESREHHVPQDKHLLVHAGDHVDAGDPLCDGPLVPHDILLIKGEDDLHAYLIKEVQSVYRSQNVGINDKHIEVILSQMLRKVKIDNSGDSGLLPGEIIDQVRFQRVNMAMAKSVRISDPGDSNYVEGQIVAKAELSITNEKLDDEGKDPAKGRRPKPATASTQLLGITKAALQSDSFISAASFQETTKVLTEAALSSKVDPLRGLKENVILGHLIPAGTAFRPYQDMVVGHKGVPIVEAPREVQMPGTGTLAGLAEVQAATTDVAMPKSVVGEVGVALDSGAPIGPAPDETTSGSGVEAVGPKN